MKELSLVFKDVHFDQVSLWHSKWDLLDMDERFDARYEADTLIKKDTHTHKSYIKQRYKRNCKKRKKKSIFHDEEYIVI